RLGRRVVIVDLSKPAEVSGVNPTGADANIHFATPDPTLVRLKPDTTSDVDVHLPAPDVVSGFSRTDADVDHVVSGFSRTRADPSRNGAVKPAAFEPQIVGLLFADVRGFSALSDDEIPLFVERVLGAIADELSQSPRQPLIANTWGDGLYLVFDGIRETGEFALRLCERMRSADWRTMGFDHDLALRIGLHAGPAYAFEDPVTGRPNFIGAHVSRAARIEPITPPGEVYASQAFAALARSEGVQSFSCAYVGQTPMAKHYGTFPTYVIHPRTP
ncbi:MAG TPA: adenylate/guanylate cyclase domain-containing protein, partial [Vicinamibacterales bacterium]